MARDYAKVIGHLIAKAEKAAEMGPDYAEEAKSYRLKAEELMREYRISEEETIAGDAFSIVPIRFEVVLMEYAAMRSEFRHHYVEIWRQVARHAGVKCTLEYRYPKYAETETEDEKTGLIAVGYGYESDVRLAEMLWTSARLVFMTRIDAKVDRSRSDAENCYYLRNSGMARNDIALALWGSGPKDGAAHGKVQRLYLTECARRGEQPRVAGRGIQVSVYREAYADSFTDQFGWQLREARDAADSTGGSLELPGRKERVQEAFWEAFPDLRPVEETEEERAERIREHEEARENCGACKVTKSKTGKCRIHRPYVPTAADRKRWERGNAPEAIAGRRNGAAAARSVNVSRTAGPRTQSTDPAPVRPAIG